MIPDIIVNTIKDASHVVLITHVHPDGDALGSLFGLGDILEAQGKKVFRYLDAPVSYLYDFLPGIELGSTDSNAAIDFAKQGENDGGKVVAIALDCGDSGRMGDAGNTLLSITPFLVIDHHYGHREFGTHLWLDSDCSSTGEMVYELALAMDAQVSLIAAVCLYVAIVTDTGSFCYQSTSARTLRIAADLVEKGVRTDEVAAHIYENYTLERLRLMEMVLATLTVHSDARIALIHASVDMFGHSGANSDDVEGFINYPRSLSTVQVAGFIKETGNGAVSVSLRAKGNVDVAAVAATFGGGGHKNAAGFRIYGKPVQDVRSLVLTALTQAVV